MERSETRGAHHNISSNNVRVRERSTLCVARTSSEVDIIEQWYAAAAERTGFPAAPLRLRSLQSMELVTGSVMSMAWRAEL
jgi:hypothetical protein